MATVQLIETRDGWAPGADEPDDGGASLGHWLRRAREARGLTLDGITQETRIPRRHLEAIEHGDLGALPEFYQRAEVRAFARVVGVDEQLAVARLQSGSRQSRPTPNARARSRLDDSRPSTEPWRSSPRRSWWPRWSGARCLVGRA